MTLPSYLFPRRSRFMFAAAITVALGAQLQAQSLVNGGAVTGSIAPAGESDTYFFTALAGQGFQVRASDTGATAFAPEIQVFSSGGALLHSTWGNDAAAIRAAAPADGTYSVVIRDRTGTNTGAYAIEFTRAPGANEGGALPNGGAVAGTITLGDLDSYTFAANAGDALQLRVGEPTATAFAPEITLYTPSGTQLSYTWDNSAAAINVAAPVSGVYTVVIGDRSFANTGSYSLHFVRAPGANEGGSLANGGSLVEALTIGDLDSYTFSANAGEDFQVRVGDLNAAALAPEISVYTPIGGLLAYTWSNDVAAIANTAPLTGTYTVVVGDRSVSGSGPYELFFTRRPGANEGGLLSPSAKVLGAIDLGDLDSYTFSASWGQRFHVTVADLYATSLAPEIAIYSPTGALAHYQWNNTTAVISATAQATGIYTIVVADRSGPGTGQYELNFARLPGANEGGLLVNGGARVDAITLGDLDSYTFEASWGESVQLRLADLSGTAFAPQFTVYGPTGAVVVSDWSNDVAGVAFTATTTGTFTVVVGDFSGDAAGAYSLHYSRAPGANEGGLIANGASLAGYLDRGDLDSFTLNATAGESLQLVMDEGLSPALTPEIFLYGPAGALIASTWSNTVATLNAIAPETGAYTVIVGDRIGTGTGFYGAGFTRDVQSYCTAGISANGCTPTLSGIGDPSASAGSGFHVLAAGTEGNKDGLFFFGTGGRQAVPWGTSTSFQCVAQPVIRAPILDGVGHNNLCNGAFSLDFNAFAATLGAVAPAAGDQVQLQCWYRDPASTANFKTSLSNALEFTVRP